MLLPAKSFCGRRCPLGTRSVGMRAPKEIFSGFTDTGPTRPKERVWGWTVPRAEAPPAWVRRPYLDISIYF